MNKDSINLPAIPLRGITIFPNMIIHFDIGREKSVASLEQAMLKDGNIFLVTQKDPNLELPEDKNDIYSIGTICKIKQILKLPKGGATRVLVEGIERAEVIDFIVNETFLECNVKKILDKESDVEDKEDTAFKNQLIKAFDEYIYATECDGSKVSSLIDQENNLSKISDLVAA